MHMFVRDSNYDFQFTFSGAFEIRFRRAPFSEKEYNDHVKRIIRALKAEQENGALDITIE